MKINNKLIILIVLSLFCFIQLKAQIGITNTAPNNDPTYLVQNILTGSGVAISNISFTGDNQQIGAFTSGNSIGMTSWIVMSSGHATNADAGGNPWEGSLRHVSQKNRRQKKADSEGKNIKKLVWPKFNAELLLYTTGKY